MQFLRESTASQEIPLGYFLDSTNGDTEETALTIANTDIQLFKRGATSLVDKNSGGATHMANGLYSAVLDATDTNTHGLLTVYVHVAGALACKQEFMVLNASTYDAMMLNGLNNVAATDIVSAGAINTLAGAVTTVTTSINLTTNNDKTGYALTTADWNVGKTGYSLTTADWNVGKTGYSLSTAGDQSIADLILPATNTAYNDIEFLMVDETDFVTPETGLTVSVQRSINGAAFAAGSNSVAEVSGGIYVYDASASDMNGKIITFKFSATGAMDTFVVLTTSA